MGDNSTLNKDWKEIIALDTITNCLPSHYQHGQQTSPLMVTGISSFEDHLVIASNVGLIFLAHLPSLQIVRLECEKPLSCITNVSATRSANDMVAAGAADGCISIFLLPRHLTQPSCTPKAGHGNDLKRFSVGSLHSAPITSLAWSSSGLKLVTGDAAGVVGLLEMNHDSCQCLARHLFSESLPIVQLSLYKQKVAVSSEQRCIVYDLQDDRLNVVGTKPRKQPGRFGVAWSRCLPACSGVVPSAEPCNLTSSVVANDVPSVASTDDSRFVPTEISSAAFTDVPNAATADVFSNFHTDIPDVSGTVNTPVVLSSGPVVVNDDAEVSSTEVTAVVDKDDITDSKLENTEGEKNSDGGTDDNEYEDSNTTKHMITDTNITTSSTAVFTSKLSCNSVNTNHEVPAIMSTGINSRPQPTTPESEDAVLYTSRPGQRVWMAVAEGQVRTTLLIKDLPLDTRIQLPGISPSVAPPVLSSVKFENIQVMNTGQLVMHSPDSLVIFNPRTLLVEAFFYRENFIRCVSCTARSVFVLSQAGSIFCISDQPVNVGSSAILHPMHGGAEASRKLFMPPLVLKKLGEKVLTHSSNVIEGVVKLSGSIASRVTDAAAGGYIVNGVASEPCTTEGSFSRYSLSNAQLNTAAKQSLAPDGLSRSMYAETPASEQLLTQSLQERLEPPSEPRYNAPLVDANADTYQGTEARDGTPLVIRGKQRRKKHRRTHNPSTPDPESSACSRASSEVRSTTSPYDLPLATEISSEFTVEESERRLGEMLGIECLKNYSVNSHFHDPERRTTEKLDRSCRGSVDSSAPNKCPDFLIDDSQIILNRKEYNNLVLQTNEETHFLPSERDEQTSNICSKDFNFSRQDNDKKRDIDFCKLNGGAKVSSEVAVDDFFQACNKNGNPSDGNTTVSSNPLCGGSADNNLQGYEDSRTSNLGPASSLESTTSELSYYVPSLDGAGPPMQVLRSMSHHDKTILHAEDELTEEVEPMVQLSMKPNGLSAFPSTDGHSGTQEDWSEISLPTPAVAVGGSDDYFVFLDDNNHLHFGDLSERSHITWSSLRLPLSVTAFAVSSSCRSLYLVSGGCLLLCRAQHKESEQILVDSGVHDVVSSLEVGQILDQIISRLGIPVPGEEKRGSPTADEERLGSSAACDDRLESPAPGEERLGSTAPGEERLGSSSPGEERRGSSAPGEERLGSPAPSEERLRSSTPGEERLGCPAPSEERIRSPDEETEVATKSSSNRHTLLCRTDVTSSAAKSTRQDRMFSSQSRDENYLPSRINLPSFFMLLARPLASGVLAVAGDDELVFYVTDDGQVWCLLLTDSQPLRAVEAGRAVLLGSESPLRFVSLAYRDGLLWAMDAKGALHFRAGQSRECPMGLSWGVVQTDQEQDPPPVGDEEEVLERLHSHLVVDPHGLPARSLKPDTQRQHNAHDWLVHNNNNNRADKHTDECNVNDDVSRNPQSLIISHDRAGNRDFQTLSCTPEISSVFSSVVEGIREEVSVHSATQAESVATAAETVAVTTGTVAMTISSGGVAWRVTKCGSVAFRPGVCAAIPQGANTSWWAVGVGERWVDARKPLFTSGGGFVWLCVSKERRVLVLPVATMGSVWTAAGRQRWSMVSAEALYGGHGSLACLNPKGELHLVNPTNFHSEVLTLPDLSPVVCVSQRPEVLWLLTATGDLWIRGGMTSSCNMGTHWHLLDLTQISDVTLRHVSLGLELTWAVDMRGGVYMRQGGLSPPHPYACPQAWLQVDHMRLPGGALFTKVFVGPGRQLVWALDSRHCVYVRVAIFSDLPIGVTWEAVDGVRAINLSISERGRVYAVTEEGHVYERLGVAPPANYVGTAWRKLPGCLASVSVSVDDELWGLSQSGVLCRRQTLHSLHWRRADSCSEPQTAQDSDAGLLLDSETESRRQSIDESWEVIE
ncbi:uncharacterized protein LOC108676404 isoform X2 [Hyalella azteca]|uniref:Uncharacterized protein LOC108676404 isoform X2 n=1 Tax=Hyalella azteca TaxID=294128 RepID=A0A979FRZ0_HYAAZ|nr:uncharacterized protein LOC108676404 isoform X2 [Hyalella azteca]